MRLMSETYARLHRRHQPQNVSLTPEGRALLLHLAWTGPMTMGELTRHTGRAQSVVSESVAVLESHDMLTRVRDPRDNRRTLVWLTERARDWLAEEQQPLDKERLMAVLSAMDPGARDQLLQTFEEFIAVAEQLRRAELALVPSDERVSHQQIKKKGTQR